MSDKTPPPPPPGFPLPPPPPPPTFTDVNNQPDKDKKLELDDNLNNVLDSEISIPPPPGFAPLPPPPPGFIPPKKELSNSNFSPGDIQSTNFMEEETSLHKQESKLIDEETSENNIGEFYPTDVQSSEEKEDSEPVENSLKSLADSLSLLSNLDEDKSSQKTSNENSEIESDVESTAESFSIIYGSDEQQYAPLSKNKTSSLLRPSIEVDSIPGDKLHVLLREEEEISLNPNGTVRNQTIKGELILRNASKKHRAWDIEVQLKST
ncbi:MAG: hypothetical protein HOA28_02990, partial [Euryarchaeota archaeon]|nr:hypothetical protein [Euryarchaeota archaeon]